MSVRGGERRVGKRGKGVITKIDKSEKLYGDIDVGASQSIFLSFLEKEFLLNISYSNFLVSLCAPYGTIAPI